MIRLIARFFGWTKSPILWGLAGTAGFYALVFAGPLDIPFIKRYFAGHPVEYGETALFAIGLSALIIKVLDILVQRAGVRRSAFGELPDAEVAPEEAGRAMLAELNRLPRYRRGEYYVRRLRTALELVCRQGSATGLGDELKYQADLDAGRQQAGYGLFRVIVWAIPILGFLGTVVGITMALNGLRPEALDESMLNVTTGLGVKFDTTALALSMSMLLMFLHFFVERAEIALLARVDERVEADLADRFSRATNDAEGQTATLRKLGESLIRSIRQASEKQAESWQQAMETAATRWIGAIGQAGERVERAVSDGLSASMTQHAERLAAAEEAAVEKTSKQWKKLEQSQLQSAEAMGVLQAKMTEQAQAIRGLLEAHGETARLQDLLNRNLASLAGAKHIEQTVLGLAAAVHLLNARLAEAGSGPTAISIESVRNSSKAA